MQCNVEIRRAISHCGMHLHISIVANGHSEYIQDIARDQCIQIHTIGTFIVTPSLHITKLKVNRNKTSQSPGEFSYHSMKGPGYMSVIAGKVVHIVKCKTFAKATCKYTNPSSLATSGIYSQSDLDKL